MERLLRLFRSPVNKNCQYCNGLFDAGVRISATELIRGSIAGCPACQLLYQSVSPEDLSDPRIDLMSVRLFGDSIVCQIFDPRSEAVSRKLRAEEGSPSRWPLISTARHVAPAADDPESLDLIRSWLSDCNKHPQCKATSPTVLPDRVIFLQHGADPQLVETRGTRAKYIALSHRWGGCVSLQLKNDTFDHFKRGIPFSKFPKTFQDAIIICRALDVDYIWIDSICIIQDSKQDWDIQGSKMDQIYANCLLTIAADGAENGDAGFIRTSERQSLNNKTRKIVCRGPRGQLDDVFIRPMRDFGSLGGFGRHYGSWERGDLQASQRLTEQGSYLLRRGWVLQETFLPRRVLHFLPDEFSWKCATISRCECKVSPHGKVVHEPLDLELPREIDMEQLKEYWREVVEQYTRRQLTFSSDRLVALAGLASRAHSTCPDVSYYAGLWSDALPSTLLWVVDRPVKPEGQSDYPCERIQPSIAPTWSWASVTGYINFLFWRRNFDRGRWASSPPDLTSLQIECASPGPNKYGSVKGAKLMADGYLCKVHIQLTGGSKWHFPVKMETRKSDSSLDKTHGFLYPDTDEFLASLQAKRQGGASMVVASVYESRMFLVLRQVKEGELVFERVGVLHCEKHSAVKLQDWGHRGRFSVI
ncbi:hypothetical protein ACJ41O_003921 [Fusarium nematophilum]